MRLRRLVTMMTALTIVIFPWGEKKRLKIVQHKQQKAENEQDHNRQIISEDSCYFVQPITRTLTVQASDQEKILKLKRRDQKVERVLTVIVQNEESAGAEVAVELQQDVVGGAGDGFLD